MILAADAKRDIKNMNRADSQMKIFVTSLVAGLFVCASCSHECKDTKAYYKNSKEKEVFIYPDCSDKTYYKRVHFYENGQMSSEGYFRNGQKIGKFKSWAENGNQTAAWEVLDGKEHGFIQCWYDNGVKKRENNLDRGVQNGSIREWYKNGKIACEGNYVMGRKTGTWKFWKENGAWQVRNYRNDTLNGLTLEHWVDSSGVNLVSGQYSNGKEVGVWKWFDKDSVLYQAANFKNGLYTGQYTEYYKNGKIKLSGYMVDGNYNGNVNHYNEDGSIAKVEQYKNGKIQPYKQN